MAMDESELQHNIELYKNQLSQVEQAASLAGQTAELTTLISDLKELISLTEGSLLSLKKSQLLKSLEDAQCTSSLPPSSHQMTAVMDDEYLAFQMALKAEDEKQLSDKDSVQVESSTSSSSPFLHCAGSAPCSGSKRESDLSSTDSSEIEGDSIEAGGQVDNLVGMKCRAPFSHAWGRLDYHNAMVISATRQTASDSILVTVMFTTPTHNSMKPCKFYLEGHCRFTQEMCKYSHGHTVQLEELRPFVEADHSVVVVGSKCLACHTDGIWYPATVTDLTREVVSVHLDELGEDMDLDISQIVPLASHAVGNDSSDEDCPPSNLFTAEGQGRTFTGSGDKIDGSEDEDVCPLFLWKPPQTTSALGDWEAHTRGIGSRLMMKMGYVPGQGLGVEGQGKAEPVPIVLLPQGKSLDHIMELKAMAGNQDLFNAMKRLEKQQRKADKMREQAAARETTQEMQAETHTDVFDFINKKLRRQNASVCGSVSGASTSSGADKTPSRPGNAISEYQLHSKSDRDVNVQVLRTEEEIRSVERQLDTLRGQLERHENRDRKMAARVREKVAEREVYLRKLKDSSQALERHQARRKHGKKLEVF